MATLQQTMTSGFQFEDEITRVVQGYTQSIWRNIRIETLLTANGTTEMDLLFCFKDIVFIVEAKRAASIIGEYGSRNWSFVGSHASQKEVKEYSALNTITQNNIHARSFKDIFYAYFKEWPVVIPIIVVPNNCVVSHDISGAIYTLAQLDEFLSQVSGWSVDAKVHRKVAALLRGNGITVTRPDFKTNPSTGKRYKDKGGVV